jgi:ABC-type branched-subunit amino acid transport system permease subunit
MQRVRDDRHPLRATAANLTRAGGKNAVSKHMVTVVLIFAIVLFGLDLIVGYVGEVSLGHFALFAIGAYTAGLLVVKGGVPLPIALFAGTVTAALFGACLAFPALRTSGPYLAMVTLAFGTIAIVVLNEWTELTNGARGLAAPKPPIFGIRIGADGFYWLVCGVFAAAWLAMQRIVTSPYGRAFQALHGSAIAADSIGVPAFTYKILAFTLSAAFTGLAGGLYIFSEEYVTPQSFNFELTIVFLLALIVGGRMNRVGALVGAALAVWLPNLLGDISTFRIMAVTSSVLLVGAAAWKMRGGKGTWRDWIPSLISFGVTAMSFHLTTMTEQRLTIFGLVLLGAILYMPQGIIGTFLAAAGVQRRNAGFAREHLTGSVDSQIPPLQSRSAASLDLSNLTVRFGGLSAVRNLTVRVDPGTVHGLRCRRRSSMTTWLAREGSAWRALSHAIWRFRLATTIPPRPSKSPGRARPLTHCLPELEVTIRARMLVRARFFACPSRCRVNPAGPKFDRPGSLRLSL